MSIIPPSRAESPSTTVSFESTSPPAAPSRTWGLSEFLAIVGVLAIAVEAVTLAFWLADGPQQLTEFRSGDAGWWRAQGLTAACLAFSVFLLVKVVKQARTERRLTFDGMLLLGMASFAYLDVSVYNWLAPTWLYSSDFVNLNNPAPIMPNPEGSELVWPVIFELGAYPTCGLGGLMFANAIMRWAQRRRPQISTGQLVAVSFIASSLVGAATTVVLLSMDLIIIPGLQPDGLPDWAGVVIVGISAALGLAPLACLRYFKDHDGLALTERGLERFAPRTGRTIATLATIGACQLALFVAWGLATEPLVLFSGAWDHYPDSLVNGACDAPGWSGTTYGPCPGSPDFKLPVR